MSDAGLKMDPPVEAPEDGDAPKGDAPGSAGADAPKGEAPAWAEVDGPNRERPPKTDGCAEDKVRKEEAGAEAPAAEGGAVAPKGEAGPADAPPKGLFWGAAAAPPEPEVPS